MDSHVGVAGAGAHRADDALTPAAFHILLAVAEGPMHGYGMMQDVLRLTGGAVRLGPGTLYRSIQRLVRDGLLEEVAAHGAATPAVDERRRTYRLTPAGRSVAEAEAARLLALVEAARDRGFVAGAPLPAPDSARRASALTVRAVRVAAVPGEFRTITPHLTVRGVAEAVAFYHRAFGAEELLRNLAPDGVSIMHCELLLGDARFFLNDEFPDSGQLSPNALGGSPVRLHLYVEDVDAAFQQAIEAGCEVELPLADQFWGERYGMLRDPYGHRWSMSTQLEDLAPAELQRRAKAFSEGAAQASERRESPEGGRT
jgi:PhnB protein